MEAEPIPEEQPHKKGRHRKKQLYNSVLHQMEFYFSDSNLTKDRFLAQLIQSDPYVELTEFLKFNKIRKLTTNIEDIIKAVSNSDLIELSEDKSRVCRKAPVQIKENVEECTIYVERLKSDVTHEWLTSIFADFGNVVYVSIPRYKHNGMIKGFAFVEFENEEGAKSALEYFESIDCKIQTFMEPHKLCSIATYEAPPKLYEEQKFEMEDEQKSQMEDEQKSEMKDEQKSVIKEEQKSQMEDEPKSEIKVEQKTEMEDEQSLKETKKRKHSEENELEIPKKAKTETNEEVIDKETNKRKLSESGTDEIEEKKLKLESEETNLEQDKVSEGESEEKRKKKQKKAHRKKMNLKEIGLLILSRKDWKRMRNRYLDMQRKTMKQLKMHLNRQRFAYRYDNYKKEPQREEEPVQAKMEYLPGIIVKVSLSEPCEDNKKLKNEVKACSSDIKFVDIPLPFGSAEIYVRFTDSKNAQNFCDSKCTRGKAAILDGDEELQYWKKIEASKQAKQKHNMGKQRGRDKLLKKAEKQVAKHVRFDDNE